MKSSRNLKVKGMGANLGLYRGTIAVFA